MKLSSNHLFIALLIVVRVVFSWITSEEYIASLKSSESCDSSMSCRSSDTANLNNLRPSIVFVHIGDELPSYMNYTVTQARLFNPVELVDIYIIMNKHALNDEIIEIYNPLIVIFVFCEDLIFSEEHKYIHKFSGRLYYNNADDKGYGSQLFYYKTLERFFYLDNFLNSIMISNVFHLENDVMLYTDLTKLVSPFSSNYPRMATTYNLDSVVVPGFVYINDAAAIKSLTSYICSDLANFYKVDMELLATKLFQDNDNVIVDLIPSIPPSYTQSFHKYIPTFSVVIEYVNSRNFNFSQHYDSFSIFDDATIGQYLDGIPPTNPYPFNDQNFVSGHLNLSGLGVEIDPRLGLPGYINMYSMLNPHDMEFKFLEDEKKRLYPVALYKDEVIKINTLHIHSKNTQKFYSLRPRLNRENCRFDTSMTSVQRSILQTLHRVECETFYEL